MLLTLIPAKVWAENNYHAGALYFANGDYINAVMIWKPLAQQGHPDAQYSMGLLYEQGKGVEQNRSKARQLLIQAAEQDHLQAQFQLGRFYDLGVWGKPDPKSASEWFLKAAENGYAPAQHSLATHLILGNGVNRELREGIFWLQKAVEQNDTDAMRDLGFLHYKGRGVKKDFRQARDLLLLPAEDGNVMAQFFLGEIYAEGGYGMPGNSQQAEKWYQRAKQSGSKEAEQRLKTMTMQISKSNNNRKKMSMPVAADDAERFRQLNNEYYTLQIIQAQFIETISKLTNVYSDDKTWSLKITKDAEVLFVLLYGYYKSHDEAKNAITALPEPFRLKSRPWIRQVQAIKVNIP